MSIGAKVRKYREAKGFSQEELAVRLDVAQTTISSIESDKSIPNSILLHKIAKELDVNINSLLDDIKTINNVNDNVLLISKLNEHSLYSFSRSKMISIEFRVLYVLLTSESNSIFRSCFEDFT